MLTESDPPDSSEGEPSSITAADLRHYLGVLRKWAWALVALVAIASVAAVIHAHRQPKVYRATASLVIDRTPPKVLGRDADQVVELGPGWGIEGDKTQVEVLESRMLARRTVIEAGLAREPALIGGAPPDSELAINYATNALHGALQITPPHENNVIYVSAVGGNPAIVARLANAHVASYVNYQRGIRVEGTSDASRWLNKELKSAEEAVAATEKRIYEFRRDHGMLELGLESRRDQIQKTIERSSLAKNEATVKRRSATRIKQQIDAASGLDVTESPVFDLTGDHDGTIAMLKQRYDLARAQISVLEVSLGPKNSDYLAAKAEITSLHQALEREARLRIAGVTNDIKIATAAENDYTKEIDALRQEAFDLGPQEVSYQQLLRDHQSAEAKLSQLSARAGASDLESRLETGNVHPLDEALVPGAPISPELRRALTVAIIGSLMLGLCGIFLLGYFDRKLRDIDHMIELTESTMLGSLPQLAAAEAPMFRTLVEQPQGAAAESARSLRTNLLFASAGNTLHTIAITSAGNVDGKTTTSLTLGASLAETGKRVVVLDADLRRPRVAATVGTAGGRGIVDALIGSVSLDEVIKATEVKNLSVVPCGTIPPNPCELLMTTLFRDLLASLRERFDVVIIDTPPILAVADAAVVGRLVDGVILVGRAQHTHGPDLVRAEKQLRAVDIRIIGTILNGVTETSRGYYYNYAPLRALQNEKTSAR